MKELTMEDIYSKHGDYKTIFAIETGTERKFVHFLGYAYYAEDQGDKPYRFVEYCFHYVPLDEVLSKGFRAAEIDGSDSIKQYVKEISLSGVFDIYNHYDNGNPVQVLQEFKDAPDGIYILEND